ncbi:DUF5017 domain-containing protein [Puteibacter caeruleilacunae]|nr:DUF5017 domain-containing protein [Puteibacter caeruleilacunae]
MTTLFKNIILAGALVSGALAFTSCDEEIEAPSGKLIVSSTNVTVGEEVSFEVTGNPDMISFYSGEAGNNYEYKDRTSATGSTPSLNFEVYNKYGDMTNGHTYLVYSTDYDGAGDPSTATWTVLTTSDPDHAAYSLEDWGTVANSSKAKRNISRTISLDGISGETTYFAFKYIGTQGPASQKSWYIHDYKISTELEGNIPVEIIHHDFLTEGNWEVVDVAGAKTWKKQAGSYVGSIKMGEGKNKPSNEDWLIFAPLNLSSDQYPVSPDKGEAIKTTAETNKAFTHVYNAPGTYTVTVLANVWDYNNSVVESKIFEQVITVTEAVSEAASEE